MYVFSRLLPIYPDFNKPTASNTIPSYNDINTYFFVNKNVRAIFILFTLYFPSDDTWMSCLIVYIYIFTYSLLIYFKLEYYFLELQNIKLFLLIYTVIIQLLSLMRLDS